jgi:hypothetical protein
MTLGYKGYAGFWPDPEGVAVPDDDGVGLGVDSAEDSDGRGGGGADLVSSLAGGGADSSGGISRVVRSSPGSAITAIRVPTFTPFAPSASCQVSVEQPISALSPSLEAVQLS